MNFTLIVSIGQTASMASEKPANKPDNKLVATGLSVAKVAPNIPSWILLDAYC